MKKVFIYNEGCNLRGLDARNMQNYFLKNNFRIIKNPKEADYIIFYTCSFSTTKGSECLNLISFFKKFDAELIVAGCLPAIQPEQLSKIFNGKIIKTEDLKQHPEKVDKLFPDNKIKYNDINDSNIEFENFFKIKTIGKINQKIFRSTINPKQIYKILLEKFYIKIKIHILKNLLGENSGILNYYYTLQERPPYHLRISWGCTGNCTYCGIKKAIGSHVSKPLDICLSEFKEGIKLGYKDFYIESEDTGPYGLDIGSSLPELLDKLIKIEGDYNFFIEGLSPLWVVKYLDQLEELVKRGKIKLMLCAFQSGSSRILKLMKRYNDVEIIKEAYLRLMKADPNLVLFPHIIIGFPTETEEDLEKTLLFIKDLDFNSGNYFPFSCIAGTEAEKINQKIPQDIIKKRMKYVKKFLKKAGYRTINLHYISVFYKKTGKK